MFIGKLNGNRKMTGLLSFGRDRSDSADAGSSSIAEFAITYKCRKFLKKFQNLQG